MPKHETESVEQRKGTKKKMRKLTSSIEIKKTDIGTAQHQLIWGSISSYQLCIYPLFE